MSRVMGRYAKSFYFCFVMFPVKNIGVFIFKGIKHLYNMSSSGFVNYISFAVSDLKTY